MRQSDGLEAARMSAMVLGVAPGLAADFAGGAGGGAAFSEGGAGAGAALCAGTGDATPTAITTAAMAGSASVRGRACDKRASLSRSSLSLVSDARRQALPAARTTQQRRKPAAHEVVPGDIRLRGPIS